jgi:hypothetical protein
VFISPHHFFPTDKGWKFNGPLETDEAVNGYFARKGRLTLEGFTGSGADWLERFKPYIEDGKPVVVSPHRVWGPETNDLVLQLRKRRIGKIILGGMLARIDPMSRRLTWPFCGGERGAEDIRQKLVVVVYKVDRHDPIGPNLHTQAPWI